MSTHAFSKFRSYTGRDGRRVRVWTCDICRKPFEWGPQSSWHGSWANLDDGDWDAITVVCSSACRSRAPALPCDPYPEAAR